uniref:Cadherin domain-containing protein n=1 Tax=Panagrolaimus sp. PS1159 TaxID=55785 RepID=A0AC35EWA8_9BILA
MRLKHLLTYILLANTLITVILDDSVSIYELTPRFEQSFYRFEIEENQPPQPLGNVQAHHRATEVDNDQMVYTLNSNTDANSFSIDPSTGELSSTEEFDREKQHLYKIQ